MFSAIAKGLARLALFAAALAFLSATTLFLLGGYLMTWPVMRKSPRNRKLVASSDLAVAAMTALAVFEEATRKPALSVFEEATREHLKTPTL